MFQYDSIEWKVQHFYESCKSLDYIESDKEKPLMKIINNLGGKSNASNARVSPDLTSVLQAGTCSGRSICTAGTTTGC